MAAVLAPCVLAAEQGSGSRMGPGGQGTGNGMQALPSGGSGTNGQAGSDAGQIAARHPGGMGNMTAPAGDADRTFGGNRSGMMPPDGGGNFMGAGNLTSHQPRMGMDGNMTPRERPGFETGNGTFSGNAGVGTLTPMEPRDGMGGNWSAPGANGARGMAGNGTMLQPGPGMGTGDPATPGTPVSAGQDDRSLQQQSGGEQQGKDDLIADLISRLQSLLGSRK